MKGEINSTLDERHVSNHSVSNGYFIALIIFKSICILLGVSGNLLVIIHNVVLRYEKTPATYLTTNLAISDLLACLTIYPLRIGRSVVMLTASKGEEKSTFFCKLNYLSAFFSVSLSVLTLLAVTYDRYLFIKKPLKYPMLMTKRKVCGMIGAIWSTSLLYLTLAIARVKTSGAYNNCFFGTRALSVLLLLYIYTPILFILLFNLKTWRIAQTQRRSIARNYVRDSSAKNVNITTRIAKELKAVETLAMLMGVLVVCFSPSAVMVIFDLVKFYPGIPPSMYDLFSDLIGINSVFNPLIYCIRHKEYRKVIHRCFHALCC